jgi:nucleotide-binding universal stress UspA family protein
MHRPIAYMPIETYPEAAPDADILGTMAYAEAQGFGLHVTTFAVDVPPVSMPAESLVSLEAMARTVEARSTAECERVKALLERAPGPGHEPEISRRRVPMGAAFDAASTEARYFDLSILPWSAKRVAGHDLAEALLFGAGRPVLLVPAGTAAAPVIHVAVAWDESRAAARALGDALPLLSRGVRISVLTVGDEKALRDSAMSVSLAAALARRGYEAQAVDLALGDRTIGAALQAGALAQGAQLLVMGGFGHSRLREFFLGGATQGILTDLKLPVLLSH